MQDTRDADIRFGVPVFVLRRTPDRLSVIGWMGMASPPFFDKNLVFAAALCYTDGDSPTHDISPVFRVF